MEVYSNILAKLKQYNFKPNESDEFNIRTLIDDIKIDITTYCNLKEYPLENSLMDNILVNLVVFTFFQGKSTNVSNDTTATQISDGNVRSVNIGDFSVTYGGVDGAFTNEFITKQINKYYTQLNKFRKVRW